MASVTKVDGTNYCRTRKLGGTLSWRVAILVQGVVASDAESVAGDAPRTRVLALLVMTIVASRAAGAAGDVVRALPLDLDCNVTAGIVYEKGMQDERII